MIVFQNFHQSVSGHELVIPDHRLISHVNTTFCRMEFAFDETYLESTLLFTKFRKINFTKLIVCYNLQHLEIAIEPLSIYIEVITFFIKIKLL